MKCNLKYFKGDIEIIPARYSNGRLAINFVSVVGEPIATATVNMPDIPLEDDEIIIKDWSENEGVLDFLESNGLVKDTGKIVGAGFTIASIVKVTDKLKTILSKGD